MTKNELYEWVVTDPAMVCSDENLDADQIDVLEYWIVSEWFAGQLSRVGEAVVEVLDFHIWGRTTSGQHISLDGVLLSIAQGSLTDESEA